MAFCRSADGTVVITCAGNPPVFVGVKHRLDRLIRPHRRDVALADVHFDLERRHVDDRADAGAREAAAGRDRRDHLARLRVFRDRHAVERRAHDRIRQVPFTRFDAALGDCDLLTRHRDPGSERVDARHCRVHFGAPDDLFVEQLIEPGERQLGLAESRFVFGRGALRRRELRALDRQRRADLRIVEPREHLSLVYGLAFLDEDLEDLARHLG